jgi:hypothetical protein
MVVLGSKAGSSLGLEHQLHSSYEKESVVERVMKSKG